MNDTSEKEIVYKFDMHYPESAYTRPLYGKQSRKHFMIIQIVIMIIVIEAIILMIIDHSSSRIFFGIVPLAVVLHGVKSLLIAPNKRRKYYKKVHAENEDFYSCTFFTDCVNLKTPTVDATFNYDSAEYYTEDAERLMIFFTLGRSVTIVKNQCNTEQLEFFRNIVPEESQRKKEKKNFRSFLVKFVVMTLIAIFYAFLIYSYNYINKNAYYPEYPCTTYESFEECLNAGTIEDVVIIKNKYIEYTYTGRMKNERYYTVYSGNTAQLEQILENADVNWKYQ